MKSEDFEYAGFWVRLGASLIDTVLFILITMPLSYSIYGDRYFLSDDMFLGGWDVIISWLLPLVATVLFWVYRSATPGKMAFKLKVVNADTGESLSLGKSFLRYVAYYASAIPLCLGFLWVAFSGKKQGWHDKIANTVVVRSRKRGVEPVEFNKVTEQQELQG
ncbi:MULTISPECIES: RDD family protein [unclassified Halomonas]|uniref:RDD family protein n=1 Tax=unclassified Halomonas TaxID=2609666 RepID=UPI0020A17659|nr:MULTISPECIES: RDD family protein [unclassified Halomonas]MCP1313692.1 RDD family protein [Halomonas sp. 707D7]MCP1327062.1 RDD family protein [Halomonas sp. 707D4]